MTQTKNATLVLNAEKKRRTYFTEATASLRKHIAMDSMDGVSDFLQAYGPWARELNYVNKHITVPQAEIDDAARAYNEVAKHLVEKLHWSNDDIKVLPQGSASTLTLIRSPDNSKFDIDAVCQVNISRIAALDPMGFFHTIGETLRAFSAEQKKRCWNIPFNKEPFYLEFTPSVPLDSVPPMTLDSMAPLFRPSSEYLVTALAVVDTPSQRWKTSNPAGLTKWVDDTSKKQLVRKIAMESASFSKAMDSVAPVPDQDVEITDTLRVAIRLFKRHRDMCVRRNQIDKDFKPISIIIVTLLTRCYAGLSDLNRIYNHPVELLEALAELMSGMVDEINGELRVDNPTVPGENFAERWNGIGGKQRQEAFFTWCDILSGDLQIILAAKNDQEIQRRVRDVFGCNAETTTPSGGSGGSGGKTTSACLPPAAIRTSGLA
jgi:hypothetical protein